MENIDPNEVIYSITMFDVIRAIERHIGKEEASALSTDDLSLASSPLKNAKNLQNLLPQSPGAVN